MNTFFLSHWDIKQDPTVGFVRGCHPGVECYWTFIGPEIFWWHIKHLTTFWWQSLISIFGRKKRLTISLMFPSPSVFYLQNNYRYIDGKSQEQGKQCCKKPGICVILYWLTITALEMCKFSTSLFCVPLMQAQLASVLEEGGVGRRRTISTNKKKMGE